MDMIEEIATVIILILIFYGGMKLISFIFDFD